MTPAAHTGPRCDLPAIHAAIAPVDALIEVRRTLYQLAAELVDLPAAHPLSPDLVDSPAVRGLIGRAMAVGRVPVDAELVPITAVVADDGKSSAPLVSRPGANELLSDAVAAVDAQLIRQAGQRRTLRLLTEVDGARFRHAVDLVHEGVELARLISRDLVDDLLTHVSLVGVVDPDAAAPLVSASAREFPGLVLLDFPGTAIEVAEGLVHEAAHQKLFDLAITGAMLTSKSDSCPPFEPNWPPPGRQWQMEQTLAAGHAYSCLAEFADDAARMGVLEGGPNSLLPMARERSVVIGEWLHAHREYLGPDAQALLDGLLGLSSTPTSWRDHPPTRASGTYVVERSMIFRRCSLSDRVVVGRLADPVELYVISEEAAVVLELLGSMSVEDAVEAYNGRSKKPLVDCASRFTALASSMAEIGLLRAEHH